MPRGTLAMTMCIMRSLLYGLLHFVASVFASFAWLTSKRFKKVIASRCTTRDEVPNGVLFVELSIRYD